MKDKTWAYKAVFWSTIAIIIIVIYLALTSCEQTDWRNPECCWRCKSQVTYYKPQPGIDEMTTIVTYSDSLYCNCTDEQIKWLETEYTKTDTVDGIKRETVFKCRK